MQPQCNCPIDYYVLPNIDFVGGSTQEIDFHCYFYRNKEAFDLTKCTGKFSITSFVNKTSRPVVSKDAVMVMGEGDDFGTPNIFRVNLEKNDTLNLSGKYIYQLTVNSDDGAVDIPGQGTIYIQRNIDKSAAL